MPRSTISPASAEARARVIKSLAHPSRIIMVEALSSGEKCVCDLAALVGADMSTVSRHLAVLKNAGVVAVEKRGLNQFYRLHCTCMKDFFICIDAINKNKK